MALRICVDPLELEVKRRQKPKIVLNCAGSLPYESVTPLLFFFCWLYIYIYIAKKRKLKKSIAIIRPKFKKPIASFLNMVQVGNQKL